MTQIIEFDGTKHYFPDDASRDEIAHALMGFDKGKEAPPTDWSPSSIAKNAVAPITDIPQEYSKEVNQSVDQMRQGVNEFGAHPLKGATDVGLGAAGYLSSPLSAPIHSLVGKPVENVTGSPMAGSFADLAASLALPMPKGIPRLGKSADAAAPSTEELHAAAVKGFESPEVSQLAVKPSALKGFSSSALQQLTDMGLDENVAPKTWAILRKLDNPAANSVVTGKNLKSLRQNLGEAAGSSDDSERKAATEAIDNLDKFVPQIPQASILRGDPTKVAKIWNEARGNYAAAKRSERIHEALDKAELQAGSAHSGQNIDNATRQKIKAILTNPKARRGYSKEELAQMRRVVMGTFTGDKARFIANLAGKGGGLGAFVAGAEGARLGYQAGGEVGAIVGAATPAIGYAFGKISNAITSGEIKKLDELIRSRSPLAAQIRGPMTDWGKAAIAYQGSSTPKNIARLLITSRNLANNLKDAGITTNVENLIAGLQGPAPTEANPDRKGDKQR